MSINPGLPMKNHTAFIQAQEGVVYNQQFDAHTQIIDTDLNKKRHSDIAFNDTEVVTKTKYI